MQLQRDVRVLGRVLGGALDRHLVERDLLRALAGDVLVLDRVDAEVQLRAGIHVVARRCRVQHVGLEHRVVAHAARARCRSRCSTCASYLRWWPTFAPLRVLEQRLQPRERLSPGRAGPARRRSRARAGGRRPCRARCRTRRRRSRLACSRGWSVSVSNAKSRRALERRDPALELLRGRIVSYWRAGGAAGTSARSRRNCMRSLAGSRPRRAGAAAAGQLAQQRVHFEALVERASALSTSGGLRIRSAGA